MMFFQRLVFIAMMSFPLFCSGLDIELHINRDTSSFFTTIMHACSFNDTEVFSMKNRIISASVGEEINVTVINNDNLPHTFTIDNVVIENNEIEAGSTGSFSITLNDEGSYRYYSNKSYGKLIGASGILLIGYDDFPKYYWNLYDLESGVNEELSLGQIVEVPLDYKPELFFINGANYPATLDDENTYVDVQINQEVIISIVNSGNMEHVLHFHGFHVEILQADILSSRVGWVKDTLPIKCGESMTVKLIAFQEGLYPVHDHNLIAVTNIGFYAGGMLTFINVEQ